MKGVPGAALLCYVWTSAPHVLSVSAALLLGARLAQADQWIYTDSLQNSWEDWGWTQIDYANTGPVHSGSDSVAVTMINGFDGMRINRPLFDSSPYSSLSFSINGGSTGGQQLWVRSVVSGNFQPPVSLTPPAANTWTDITVSLSALSAANRPDFEGIVLQDASSSPQATFYLDDIRLVSIPEPSALTVLAAGIIAGAALHRARVKAGRASNLSQNPGI